MTVTRAVVLAKGADGIDPGFGPLAALPVANLSLIERVLDSLALAGVERIAVVVEPGAERVKELISAEARIPAVEIDVIDQPPGEGLEATLEAVGSIVGAEPFILHLGESLCWDLQLDWYDATFGATDAVILVHATGDRIEDAGPQPLQARRRSRFGHLGIYVVGSDFGAALAAVPPDSNPAAAARAAVRVLAGNGGQTHYWRHSDAWQYSHEPKSLLEVNRLALTRLRHTRAPGRLIDSEIHGPVEIHPSAVIESSVIRGPVAVGPRSHIREAYLGPHAAVGSDVRIEGAEVGNSVVMDGASIQYLNERLEASVIGPKARVTRDFRLPHAVRLELGPAAEVVLT